MIDPDLARFLQEGLGIHIGTRNERLEPSGARATAVKVDPDGLHLTVYLAKIASERILPDLHANGEAAISFGRPIDERACQVKGRFVSARATQDDERDFLTAQWQGFMANLGAIGIPARNAEQWPIWPSVAIRLAPTAIFEQTPGPDAGKTIA